MKKILWKSDFRLWTVFFGTITLFCLVMGLLHVFVDGRPEEAFGSAIAGLIPLALTLVFAFTDSDALTRSLAPEERRTPEAEAVWEKSCLNPENPVNADRIARWKDKDRPIDIG
ncbi:MAG TPA: hypothetical protein VL283_04430 [Candidatus Baltobacteraceae bacterium]|nr:hypothetical protein [Candidatus Baltobacteraceae bacterium]